MTKRKNNWLQDEEMARLIKDAPPDLRKPIDPKTPDDELKPELLRRFKLARKYLSEEHRQWAVIAAIFPDAFTLQARGRPVRPSSSGKTQQLIELANYADAHPRWRANRKMLNGHFPELVLRANGISKTNKTIIGLILRGRKLREQQAEEERRGRFALAAAIGLPPHLFVSFVTGKSEIQLVPFKSESQLHGNKSDPR